MQCFCQIGQVGLIRQRYPPATRPFNQGEVCTCPSRALIQQSIFDDFLALGLERVKRIRSGHPLDTDTMIGAQASNDQLEKILAYVDIGQQEGAKLMLGGKRVGEVIHLLRWWSGRVVVPPLNMGVQSRGLQTLAHVSSARDGGQ